MVSNIATNIIGFILVLGFLVYVHEAGHFLFAKLFKVRVLVFSFGFGKRLFGFQRGDTDYRVSLIPLGGYVKMAGDNPEEDLPPDPHHFLSRPKWQRFLILLAGPAMNLLIAVAFLAAFYMVGFERLREAQPILGSILPDRPAAAAGLQQGDVILTANGEEMRTWEDFRLAIAMNANSPVRIEYLRNGERRSVVVTPERQETDYGVAGIIGVTPFIVAEVGRVLPDSAAERAGLQAGDLLVLVDGKPIGQLGDLEEALEAGRNKSLPFVVERRGERVELTLPSAKEVPQTYPGIVPPTVKEKLALGAAIEESIQQNIRMVRYTFATIARMFRAEGSVKELSGPINIARISGEMLRSGWQAVVFLMANISLQLGILNLLPIPILDGGHIMILAIEGIARRDLSLRVKERIQQLGFAMLAALMLIVIYNDVIQNVMLLRRG
ncbi:MAG TPA: RIP metalloprotease RseP [Thermoanaerobaculia bacterium]|nr:RIP metalloprotease RseP [Thermoanaerobaculia bacterium]